MTPTCRVCAAETDAYLCQRCSAEIVDALNELPKLLPELEVTLTRQDRGTGTPLYAMRRSRLWHEGLTAAADRPTLPPALRSKEGHKTLPTTPWPISWDASNLLWSIENTLTTWARHLLEARWPDGAERVLTGPAHPHDDWEPCPHRSCARIRDEALHAAFVDGETRAAHTRPGDWLARRVDVIRMDEAAAAIHDEITSLPEQIMNAVDRQDPDIYAGPCDSPDVRVEHADGVLTPKVSTCGADLYARLGDVEVKCGVCGATYDLAERKTWLVEQIPDAIAPTSAIANALTSLLEPVTPSMIRQMAFRSEIIARGKETDGRGALYRVGDVMEVLAKRAERKAAKLSGVRRRFAS